LQVSETVFWFVVVPALVVLVVGGLAYAMGGGRRGKRYRPGRPYDMAPVWFLSAPEQVDEAARKRAIGGRPQEPAMSTGVVEAGGGRAVPQGSTGGASDRW
jgi:hypothetical protein